MRELFKRFMLPGICAGAFVLVATALAGAAEVPKFEVDPFWPKPLPNNWTLGQVAGVAVDEHDHVWIMQRPRSLSRLEKAAAAQNPPAAKCCVPAPPVIEFDPEGNVVQAWGGPGEGYDWPKQEHGIRVDGEFRLVRRQPQGGWLSAEIHARRKIRKADRQGRPAQRRQRHDPARPARRFLDRQAPPTSSTSPTATAITASSCSTRRRGAYKRHWGAYGKRPADEANLTSTDPGGHSYDPKAPPSQSFNNPVHCVKIANDGLVYVCDRSNDRLQVFQKDGSFVREWMYLPQTLSGSVWDLYLWPDKDAELPGHGRRRQQRDAGGAPRRRRGGGHLRPFRPHGRAIFRRAQHRHRLASGNVFTTEVFEGKRIQKWKVVSGAPQK